MITKRSIQSSFHIRLVRMNECMDDIVFHVSVVSEVAPALS